MKLFKQTKMVGLSALAGACVLTLAACDDNNVSRGDGVTQVDRMARAGVNTAVTNPFFRDEIAAENALHGDLTDQYNSQPSQNASVNNFAGIFQGNLAIYDGLDRNCGNQLAADQIPDNRYAFLAGALANDEVFVNSLSGVCNQYFGVELNALGITNQDCGGRTPLYDVIDVTYSALAIGAVSGVGDGVDSDPDPVTHSNTVFPFLAPPT